MNILERIFEAKKEEVEGLKRLYRLKSFEEFVHYEKKCVSVKEKLQSPGISIISEIKRASPSKGVIKNDFDHNKIAEAYLESETDAISVLTDRPFFQGDIKYLNEIAHYSPAPLLRKDFIIDEFQIFEAKGQGADFILLIAEILEKSQIDEFSDAAISMGMEVLLEIHSENELPKTEANRSKITGINNRDLNTFVTDINTTFKLKELLPDDHMVVSESGFLTEVDYKKISGSGINGILIGEYFMKAKDIKSTFKNVREWLSNEG